MAPAVPPILAAASYTFNVALWSGLAAGLILVLSLAMYIARRYRTRALTHKEPPGGGLTVDKAEQMYRSGLISREEFSALRRSLLGLPPVAGRPGGTAGAGGGDSGLRPPGRVDDVNKDTEEPEPPIAKEQE